MSISQFIKEYSIETNRGQGTSPTFGVPRPKSWVVLLLLDYFPIVTVLRCFIFTIYFSPFAFAIAIQLNEKPFLSPDVPTTRKPLFVVSVM